MLAYYNKIRQLIFLILYFAIRLAHFCHGNVNGVYNDDENNYKLCWYTNSSQCIVHATLRQEADTKAPILPLEIDCRQTDADNKDVNLVNDNSMNSARPDYILRNFKHTLSVTLNGCHTPLQMSTYIGFEYLPHCNSIRRVVLERFHSDIFPKLSCAQNQTTMIEMLYLQHNELLSINRDSLHAYGRHLREMHIMGNSLRHIERQVCNILLQIELIEISNEVEFMLKSTDGDLFYNCSNLRHIKLHKLHSINVQLFEQLPLTLRTLMVSETVMEFNDAVLLQNPQQLLNVSFINCALHTFILLEVEASLLYLNLSDNMLKEFQSKNIALIEILDLSYNQMSNLPLNWLEALPNLKYISLQGNILHKISLTGLLNVATNAQLIDLRNNRLILLTEDGERENVKLRKSKYYDYERVRLQVGNNPWNCKWLLHFAHMQPEKFHIFQYDKFISQLNVNGLTCSMESMEQQQQELQNYTTLEGLTSTELPTAETVANYTFVYGSNWERRNQRAEALIIVFLLPLGIACLFVLLYMWIYCQKVFHWSFYRSCHWPNFRTGINNNPQMAGDVRRNLAQNANDNYEVPLNGILTICNNCKGTPCNMCNSKTFEPQAPFNITYESMPYDEPHKLYEEITSDEIIIASEDDKQMNTNTTTTTTTSTSAASTQQQIYDHLSFEQPATYI